VSGIYCGSCPYIQPIITRRARIWRWTKTRRYDGLFNEPGPSSRRLSYLDCIIATPGYDFREGLVSDSDMLSQYRFVAIELGRRAGEAHLTLAQNVMAIGQRKRSPHILLDQEYR
jgi:hypothetical protein